MWLLPLLHGQRWLDLDQGLPIFLIPLKDSKDYELCKGKITSQPLLDP